MIIVILCFALIFFALVIINLCITLSLIVKKNEVEKLNFTDMQIYTVGC